MLKKMFVGLSLVAVSMTAMANTIVIGTRVIYPSDQKNINIQLQNNGSHPSLIQSWVDEGDADSLPQTTKAPFVLTPPMVRVEPKSGQTLRLMFVGSGLPQDRESLFYFNVLDVPPKPKAEDLGDAQNYLQFAVRNRLKLFYRPVNLSMTVQESYNRVAWRYLGGDKIEIDNQTPYHITYNTVRIGNQVSSNLDMLLPFSKLEVEVPDSKRGDKVLWSVVTDYGGIGEGESVLQ